MILLQLNITGPKIKVNQPNRKEELKRYKTF